MDQGLTDEQMMALINGESEGLSDDEMRAMIDNQSDQSFSQSAKRIGQNLLGGYAQFGHNIVNLPYNVAKYAGLESAEKIPHQKNYDFAALLGQPKKETSDLIAQGIAEYLPSMLLPGGAAGSAVKGAKGIGQITPYIKAALKTAAPQMGYSGVMALGDNPEELVNSLGITGAVTAPFGALGHAATVGSPGLKTAARGIGAAGGAGLGYLGSEALGVPDIAQIPTALLSGYLTERGLRPQAYAQKRVFEGIEPETVKPYTEAAERLGLDYITPAEAMGDPFSGAIQASIGKTPEAAKLKYERSVQRMASEENAINNFFDDIYTDTLDPLKKEFYDKALATPVLPDFENRMVQESNLINKAVKKLETDPAFKDRIKRNKIERGTLGYWDEVKRALGVMEEQAVKKSKTKAAIIGDVRRDMVSELDSLYPDYERARALGQRDIIRGKLENEFDRKDLTGLNFYNSILKSDKKFNKLISDLNEFPEIQQQLQDMKLVFPRLINPQTGRTAHGQEATSMNKSRGGFIQDMQEIMSNTIGKKSDLAQAELITQKDWLNKLSKSKELKENPLLGSMIEYIGRISGQTAGANKND